MLDLWLAALLDSSLKGLALCLAAGAAALAAPALFRRRPAPGLAARFRRTARSPAAGDPAAGLAGAAPRSSKAAVPVSDGDGTARALLFHEAPSRAHDLPAMRGLAPPLPFEV